MSVDITFYGASRKCDNQNSSLDLFLQSIVECADNPRRIEVLVAVDADDDLYYFETLEKKYTALLHSFKVIVSKVRYGYTNLHLYYKMLFSEAAKTTRLFCGYSDDCRITMPSFDTQLLKIDSQFPDNIYFIHTGDTHRERYLGDVSQNLLLLFWVMQAKEPASYFPYVSKKIIDIAQEYAQKHDMKEEWCPVANSWILDCYIDILSIYIRRLGVDRICYLPNLVKLNETSITVPHQRPPHVHGLSPNNVGFIKMLNNETQHYLFGLAHEIVMRTEGVKPSEMEVKNLLTAMQVLLPQKTWLAKSQAKMREIYFQQRLKLATNKRLKQFYLWLKRLLPN